MPQLPTTTSTADALAFFDGLPPIECERLLGSWSGQGFASGHPLDGALEAIGWHGKRFDSVEAVHPLVFNGWDGSLVPLSARPLMPGLWLVLRWPWLKRTPLLRVARFALPAVRTSRAQARLRMLRHRGVLTAAMVYDHVPIIDVFRRVDDERVLGLMDLKGMREPFFFQLRREPG
ncbi:MAG TPA: DUF4334 domain-containing protein [Ramlibacter sp.]|nr:DUF4334 domain-containing protein [Ramlibacter sp.]